MMPAAVGGSGYDPDFSIVRVGNDSGTIQMFVAGLYPAEHPTLPPKDDEDS
jgi:hypothetical protein